MKRIAALLLLVLVSGPAWSSPAPAPEAAGSFTEFHDPFADVGASAVEVSDPLEPLNRASFWVNDKIYRYLLAPFCELVPERVRSAVHGSLAAVFSPGDGGTSQLDLRFRDGGSELGRFLLRGVLRLAYGENASPPVRIFAATETPPELWGEDVYLVLPVWGPATVREALDRITSVYLHSPAALLTPPASLSSDGDSSLGEDLETYQSIRRLALDPYLFIRNAFSQRQGREREEPFRLSRDGTGAKVRMSLLQGP